MWTDARFGDGPTFQNKAIWSHWISILSPVTSKKARCPALVISKDAFNKATGLAICCPITNTDRCIRFHVSITGRTSLTGFVMCEQVKSLDFRARGLKLIERAPEDVLEDVLAIVDASVF